MCTKQTNSLKRIACLCNAFLIIVIILDPTNSIFKLKQFAYVVFFLFNISYLKFSKISVFVIVYFCSLIFISFSIELFKNTKYDIAVVLNLVNTILFITYILWDDSDYLESFKYIYIASIVLSIITVVIYIMIKSVYTPLIIAYSLEHDNFVTIGGRKFIGIAFNNVFFKTSPLVIIPFSYSLFCIVIKNNKIKYFIISLLFFMCLIISGTRANMLAAITSIGFTLLYYLFMKRRRILFIFVFLVGFFGGMFLFIMLISDTTEHSLQIKASTFQSYINLFSNNPIQFITGSGPASTFYVESRYSYMALTEFSYLEFIRIYGIFATIIIIFIYFYPLGIFVKKLIYEKESRYYPFILGYILYLIIGGTNPLLFSSTGLIAMISSYMLINEKNLKKAFYN